MRMWPARLLSWKLHLPTRISGTTAFPFIPACPMCLADIGTMYSSPDTVQTMSLLHLYHVRYVYVGALERSTYGPLNKFDHMAGLRVVYQSDGVTIYEVL